MRDFLVGRTTEDEAAEESVGAAEGEVDRFRDATGRRGAFLNATRGAGADIVGVVGVSSMLCNSIECKSLTASLQ